MRPEFAKYGFAFKVCCFAFFTIQFTFLHAQLHDKAVTGTESVVRIDSIGITGNKTTKDKIILREVMIQSGEVLSRDLLDSLILRSKENLMNTLLFNFVEIAAIDGADTSAVRVMINVVERWYIWPVPILKINDRNFNVWWQTKDFSRLSYGFYIDWKNFRGRKENLIARFQWGYEREVMMQYLVPYLNRKKTLGMSFGFGYSRQKETAFRTMYNKQEFFSEPESFVITDGYGYGQFLVRRGIYNSHFMELRYDQHHFSDSLVQTNVNYSIDSATKVKYMSFGYQYKSDHRDFKSYPLKGYYFDVGLVRKGLLNFHSNSINTIQVLATFRKYWELNKRFYFASGLNGQVSAGLHPYFILRGIGYDRDIVRSYEYYLVDARHFAILKNNIKFALIPQKARDINFIGTEKFSKIYYALYLNVFVDAGYGNYDQDFGQETNDLQNSLLLGYGAGIDFVTYYDVVMRLEFSVNLKNETGVYLHFRAPI